jgi:hypothetical protein
MQKILYAYNKNGTPAKLQLSYQLAEGRAVVGME